MVQNLPHRIMRLILLFSAKIEGPVDSFLIVFARLFVRKRERKKRETDKKEEKRREREAVWYFI